MDNYFCSIPEPFNKYLVIPRPEPGKETPASAVKIPDQDMMFLLCVILMFY